MLFEERRSTVPVWTGYSLGITELGSVSYELAATDSSSWSQTALVTDLVSVGSHSHHQTLVLVLDDCIA